MPIPTEEPSAPETFGAATEQLRQWRAAHPTATLREIERETDRQLARVRADLVARIAQGSERPARPDCPSCGRLMRRVGVRQRTVTTAQEGQLHLHGARYRCSACGTELFPLAEALDLGSDSLSPWLRELAVRLGAELPFATAAELLQYCTGTRLSPATLRRLTLASGEAVGEREEVARCAVEAGTAPPAPCPPDPLLLSVDGSMVPLVGGEWREVRLAAIGRLPAQATDPPTTDLAYTATLGTADAFGREALGELHRRGLGQAPTVVAVSDGAPWIQGFVDLHCPQAIRILDFAHAASYLAQAAQASLGPGTAATSEWFATQRHELRHGDPDQVLAALRALPASGERETAGRYLSERRDMIGYRALSEAGWPIGSGCVESAHKTVLQARLKRSGMHWCLVGAQAMITLRLTLANGRWEEQWPQVGRQQRQQQRARTAARRRERAPTAPPLPPLPGPPPRTPCPTASPPVPPPNRSRNGKPAADHPWRRPLFRFTPRPETQM